jgi:hypothetical protein
MHRKNVPSAWAAIAAYAAAAPALAQLAPTVVINFTGSAGLQVPIDPWTSAAAALFIAVIAMAYFRRRTGGGTQRAGFWLAAIVAVAAAAIGSAAFNVVSNAYALPPTSLPLATSPASIAIGGSNATLLAQNVTGTPITLTSVQLVNAINGQTFVFPATTCLAGMTLAPSATCNVVVQAGKT